MEQIVNYEKQEGKHPSCLHMNVEYNVYYVISLPIKAGWSYE